MRKPVNRSLTCIEVPFIGDGFGQPVIFSANITTLSMKALRFTDGGKTIYFTRNQVLPKKLESSSLQRTTRSFQVFPTER